MNDATSRTIAATSEAGTPVYANADEALDAARMRYVQRTGTAPTSAVLDALARQVRDGYGDGTRASIGSEPIAPSPLVVRDEQGCYRVTADTTARAEHVAERMDGLTIAEAATESGHTARAIRARVDRGTLRAWKGPDGKRRIPRADLEHAGLLEPREAATSPRRSGLSMLIGGSGSGSTANAAQAAAPDMSGFALALWDKAEQAVREATEHRLLAMQSDTRLREAEATAKRFEDALHEARTAAAVAEAEASQLRQRLAALDSRESEKPATEEDSPTRRRWFRRR